MQHTHQQQPASLMNSNNVNTTVHTFTILQILWFNHLSEKFIIIHDNKKPTAVAKKVTRQHVLPVS